MYEATGKAVEDRDSETADSKRKADYEVSVPLHHLSEYAEDGFVECEVIVPSNNGHPYKSICRMSYDEAIILSRLPAEDNTPIPIETLFGDLYDDVLLARARGIRGGLVKTEGDLIYRTDVADKATYIIRKKFRDVRAKTLQHDPDCLDDITEVEIYHGER